MSENTKVIVDQIIGFSEQWAVAIGLISALLFIITLVAMFRIVLKLPADYWLHIGTNNKQNPVLTLLRNLLALLLFLAGVMMLILPGQGLLTIIVAFLISDVPFRKAILRNLVNTVRVQKGLNRIRKRFNKRPFEFTGR